MTLLSEKMRSWYASSWNLQSKCKKRCMQARSSQSQDTYSVVTSQHEQTWDTLTKAVLNQSSCLHTSKVSRFLFKPRRKLNPLNLLIQWVLPITAVKLSKMGCADVKAADWEMNSAVQVKEQDGVVLLAHLSFPCSLVSLHVRSERTSISVGLPDTFVLKLVHKEPLLWVPGVFRLYTVCKDNICSRFI